MSVDQFVTAAAAAMFLFILVGHLFLRLGLFVSVVAAVAITAAGAVGVITARRARRLRRFGEQLPDAIDLIVRSLEAGHPINVALGLVAQRWLTRSAPSSAWVDEVTYGSVCRRRSRT
jgi:tight adherence protein B